MSRIGLVGFILAMITVGTHGMTPINNGPTLKYVTTSVNYLWGVNARNQIFICPRPCRRWRQIPGGLKQIDAGDEEVWGVNNAGQIFKRRVDGKGSWIRIPGRLKHVSASGNGYIWGINLADHIYKCKKPCKGAWQRVSGSLKQIDGGQDYVYGVDRHDNIYTRPVDGSKGWRRIPGKLKHITASGRVEVFGVNRANQLFRCKKPCIGEWEHMDNVNMLQCDATFDSFVGIRMKQEVVKHYTGI